jgi:hypothetical protein
MPFYYASLSSLKIYYVVEAAAIQPFLKGTGLRVAHFQGLPKGRGVVSVEFQNYTGHGGMLLETCNEVEFNALTYPASRQAQVPSMPLEAFVKGMDQTKLIGGFRLYVPCDNPFAIQAGREIFGEPKFLGSFQFMLPALNLPDQKTWSYGVYDILPDPCAKPPAKLTPKNLIYSIKADLHAVPFDNDGNPSAITLYSMYPELPNGKVAGRAGYKSGRLIGSYWNIFDVDRIYKLDSRAASKISLKFGGSAHPMRADMQAVIDRAPAAFAQTYQSDPVAVENRAFYVDGAN